MLTVNPSNGNAPTLHDELDGLARAKPGCHRNWSVTNTRSWWQWEPQWGAAV